LALLSHKKTVVRVKIRKLQGLTTKYGLKKGRNYATKPFEEPPDDTLCAMNGDSGGGTHLLPPSQDVRRTLSQANLDLAIRARAIDAMTPAIYQFIVEKRFFKDVPLWITEPEDDVRATYFE